jgi:hypothetical protein
MFLKVVEDRKKWVKIYLPEYPVSISSEFLSELKKIVSDEAIEVA